MAWARPGPGLSLRWMSCKQTKGVAARKPRTDGTETQNNGGPVPLGQQSFVAQWATRGHQPGQLLPLTWTSQFSMISRPCFPMRQPMAEVAHGHLIPASRAEGPDL